MQISKTYSPAEVESKWYEYWNEKGYFNSVPDEREPYTIVIPPPNVTGVLHMGHMLNNTIQDVLVRKARMEGKNACWVPGTDHASIATEAKVVNMLKEKGIKKSDLSREEFLKYAWEWKEKHGGIILEQLKKLGASCDWKRTSFTMDENYSESVIDVFIDLYNKGLIYRGVRMINWDPKALTALSDEEVIYKEVSSKLYYINYEIEGEKNKYITIATTRPETILGDTAVCVHPDDERYKSLKGKKVLVPLINRSIPIIFDEYVEREFGTGALKVTPAHDINDYNLGLKHNLKTIDILNENGTLNKNAEIFIGEDRFKVRKEIVKLLEEKQYLQKSEDIINKVGYSERTDAVIEPKLSLQWFLNMQEISKPALENVMNDTIKFYPPKFKNTYRHWMENVKDWCISRQLWWGHRIPAWYYGDGPNDFVIAKTREEAAAKANVEKEKLRQDEDVLDTWFSSWLWPISVFDPKAINGNKNEELKYYYPTNDLVTAPEIMFFWVARMIIAGYQYMGNFPFRNVYYTGIVRDKLGRKMSKSLGNSPDPIELMSKYGADGVRVGMLFSSPAGNDLLFDETLCEQGRNFANKLWNAFRLVNGWSVDNTIAQPQGNKVAAGWFEARFNEELKIIENHFKEFRISDALMSIYKLIWDDFCAWYLEMVKPEFIDGNPQPIDKDTFDSTVLHFENLLKLLHPFMPFITEELWHLLRERRAENCITIEKFPVVKTQNNPSILVMFSVIKEVITGVRNIRQSKNISPKQKVSLYLKSAQEDKENDFDEIIIKLCNLDSFKLTDNKIENAVSLVVKQFEFYIPLSSDVMDLQAEKQRLLKELEYNKGFLISVQKKLANEKFVSNARPEIIDNEKKKLADAESKIKSIEEQLTELE